MTSTPLDSLWKRSLAWMRRAFGGRRRRPQVRMSSGPEPDGAACVHVLVGGSRPEALEGALLSDRLSPERIREVVRHASRRQLPVDTWVLWGIAEIPRRPAFVARWIASLARAAGRRIVVVRTDEMSPDTRERLAALLRRHRCEVAGPSNDAKAA